MDENFPRRGRMVVGCGARRAVKKAAGSLSLLIFMGALRLFGVRDFGVPFLVRLFVVGIGLSVVGFLIWRDVVEIDFDTRLWKTLNGWWPFLSGKQGSLDHVGPVELSYDRRSENPTFDVRLHVGEDDPVLVESSANEARARAAWEDLTDALRCGAWDRTGEHPRFREPPAAGAAAAERVRRPVVDGTYPPPDPPGRGLTLVGSPGQLRIVLPWDPLFGIAGLFVLVVEFLFLRAWRPGPPWRFFGFSPEMSTGLAIAVMLAVPIVVAARRGYIEERGGAVTLGSLVLGVPCFSKQIPKSEIIEIEIHEPPGNRIFTGRELLVRSHAVAIRLGRGLEPEVLRWMASAVQAMLRRS